MTTKEKRREMLQMIVDDIEAFDKQTNEAEYTDVCEAWNLLHLIRERIENVIKQEETMP